MGTSLICHPCSCSMDLSSSILLLSNKLLRPFHTASKKVRRKPLEIATGRDLVRCCLSLVLREIPAREITARFNLDKFLGLRYNREKLYRNVRGKERGPNVYPGKSSSGASQHICGAGPLKRGRTYPLECAGSDAHRRNGRRTAGTAQSDDFQARPRCWLRNRLLADRSRQNLPDHVAADRSRRQPAHGRVCHLPG